MDQKIGCQDCKREVPFKDLRANKTGKGWICLECYAKQHHKKTPETSMSERLERLKDPPLKPKIADAPPKGKMQLKCFSCAYKFEAPVGAMSKMCPFCGKKETLERVKSAHEILDESDHI